MPEQRSTREDGEIRPSTMTLAMRAASRSARSEPRWLRWALAREGRVVREGKLAPGDSLSVGGDGDVPSELPAARPVAWAKDGVWRLALDPRWTARIAGEGERSERADDGWSEVSLTSEGRARVVIGELALLVQIIERPAARAKAPLPPVLKGGWLARTDWGFTAFVAGSFLLHFAFVIAVIEADWPVETGIPERYVTPIFAESVPPPSPPIDRMFASDEGRDDPATVDDQSHGDLDDAADPRSDPGPTTTRPRHADRGGPSPSERPSIDPDAAARDAGRQAREALGVLLARSGSLLEGVIREGGTTPSAGQLMADVAAPQVASSDAAAGLDERAGAPLRAGEQLGRLRARPRGNGPVGEGAPLEERVVTVRVPQAPDIDFSPPDFDPNELHRALRARMTAIRRCYEHELTVGDPDTAGRVVVALRVMPVGTVASVRAVENTTGSETLAACTARTLQNIRLRSGPSEPVEVRYPIVFAR